MPRYNIMEKFTIEEIKKAIEFYNIPEINGISNKDFEDIDNLCKGRKSNTEKLFSCFSVPIPDITIVKLTGDLEKDNNLLNGIENSDDLVFYHLEKDIENYPILQSDFQFYLKNKGNIPRAAYLNINTKEIVKYLAHKLPKKISYLGDFTNEEKMEWA